MEIAFTPEQRARWARRGVTLAALGVIFGGLLARGADGAAASALFSSVLLVVLLARIWTQPAQGLRRLLAQNGWGVLGASAFVVLGLLDSLRLPAGAAPSLGVWHPIWAELSLPYRSLSIAPYRALEGVAAFLAPVAAFMLGALDSQSKRGREWTGRIIAVLTCGLALAAIAVHFAGAEEAGGRLGLYFLSPNAAATCFGVLSVLAAARVVRASQNSSHRRQKGLSGLLRSGLSAPVSLAGLSLSLACVFLTQSRAGIAASLAALLVLGALIASAERKSGKSGSALVALGLGGVAAAVLVFAGGHLVFARVAHADADFTGRAVLWAAHWQAFLDRPALGHGLNSFHEINAHILSGETWGSLSTVGSAHNIVLQALEETGVIGLALWVLTLGPLGERVLGMALKGGPGAVSAAGAFAVLFLCLTHGMVDFGLQTPAIAALLAFMLGWAGAARVRDELAENA